MVFASVNQLELAYDERGPVSGPAILLIMGLGTQMIAWPDSFCNQLAAAGFRVIRFDNRDIGLSTKIESAPRVRLAGLLFKAVLGRKVTSPYALEDMAADAVGLLDALDIDKAHIVGASMGGMIAQIVAAQYPERTLSLVSIMSSSGDPKLPRSKPKVNAVMFGRRPKPDDREKVIRYGMKVHRTIGSPGYPTSPAVLRQKVEAAVDRSYYPTGTLRQLAAIVANGSRVDLLKTITAPTLVIHGSDDPLIPVEAGIDTAAHIADAELKIIPGMGHDFPAEVTPMLAEDIIRHCGAVDQASSDDRMAVATRMSRLREIGHERTRGQHQGAFADQARAGGQRAL
jgi:pimeloyl-ACP methyl ester carboxylesterase